MLNIDFSIWPVGVLWIQIANFLVLLFVLNSVAYKPIRRIMNQRRAEMDALQKNTESFQEKYTQDEHALQENVVNARREGFTVREELKLQGLETEKGMLQDAASRTEDQLGKARSDIHQMLAGVRQTLQGEVDAFSRELAEKILGRSF